MLVTLMATGDVVWSDRDQADRDINQDNIILTDNPIFASAILFSIAFFRLDRAMKFQLSSDTNLNL